MMSTLERRRASVRALLSNFTAADELERSHQRRMLALLESDGDPFARDHYVPGHFTASAFVLSPGRDALLLILHGKLHRWLQPGGHVDPDDVDLEAAARREVAEETGLEHLHLLSRGPLDLDVHDIPSLKGAPAHAHHDVRFLFEARSRAASAASETRWVRLDQVAEVESDASVMRAVAKLMRFLPELPPDGGA